MEQKHTQLPWTSFFDEDSEDGTLTIESDTSTTFESVAEVKYQDIAGEAEANAEFIVRACNSHYELLESLKLVLTVVKKCHDCWHLSSTDEEESFVNKAIAKAEGK